MSLLSGVQLGPIAAMMSRLFAALLLFVLVGPFPFAVRYVPPWHTTQAITARPVASLLGERFGPLTVLEAWDLRSPHSGFGGFSGIALTGDRQFLLGSDAGLIARFTLPPGGRISGASIAPLPDATPGQKRGADMEALTRDPVSGQIWIAFESTNRVSRFAADLSRLEVRSYPWEIRNWSDNSGPEAMTRLADGRFLVLAEGSFIPGLGSAAVLYPSDVVEAGRQDHVRFGYGSWGMGRLTDAATLPDGRVLLLHRRIDPWQWFTSTLAVADPTLIQDRQSWTARPLAVFAAPRLSENFEAVAVAPHPRGISVWMASDNNFNDRQRTLLIHLLLPANEAALR